MPYQDVSPDFDDVVRMPCIPFLERIQYLFCPAVVKCRNLIVFHLRAVCTRPCNRLKSRSRVIAVMVVKQGVHLQLILKRNGIEMFLYQVHQRFIRQIRYRK